MKKHADLIGEVYARQNPDLEPVEVLAYVAKEIKEKFKDKFVNPNRNKQTVEGRVNNAATPKTRFELTADEIKVMNTFIRTGAMTKEQYIEEIKAMRGNQ